MEQTPLPPLLSDDAIAKVMADQFKTTRDHVVACGAARSVRNIYEADSAKRREVVQAILAKWKTELEVDGWENSIQYDKAVALAKSQLNISPTKP